MMANLARLKTCLVLAGCILCVHSTSAFADQSGCVEPPPTAAESEGLKAYIDPDTGELVDEPPPGQGAPPESPGSAEPEPEYRTEVRPDGTVALDLSERPQEPLRAEIVDGKTVLCHGSEPLPATSD